MAAFFNSFGIIFTHETRMDVIDTTIVCETYPVHLTSMIVVVTFIWGWGHCWCVCIEITHFHCFFPFNECLLGAECERMFYWTHRTPVTPYDVMKPVFIKWSDHHMEHDSTRNIQDKSFTIFTHVLLQTRKPRTNALAIYFSILFL